MRCYPWLLRCHFLWCLGPVSWLYDEEGAEGDDGLVEGDPSPAQDVAQSPAEPASTADESEVAPEQESSEDES